MGYYSSIALAFDKKSYLEFTLLKNNNAPELLEPWDALEIRIKNDNIYFEITNIKFYDNYKSVQQLNNFIEKFEENYSENHYGFLRYGGQDTDIEYRGNPGQFGMYIKKYIEINYH